jgi:hypothetical protein
MLKQPDDNTWVRARLEPEERILWEGAPNRRAFVMRGPVFLIPFTLAWLGFAIFWTVGATTSGAPFFFWIWGGGFILVGIYFAFGRFLVADMEARRTRYVFTDRRVVIRSGAFSPEYQELTLDDLPPAQLLEGRGGVGTIYFGPPDPYARWVGAGWPGYRSSAAGFVAINDAASVFRRIGEARRAAQEASRQDANASESGNSPSSARSR